MGRASRDDNYVTTLMGVDFNDMTTPEKVAVDPVNGRMLVSAIITSSSGGGLTDAQLRASPVPVSVDFGIIDNESPTGAINGVNDTYNTYYSYKPGTTKVFLNGLRQREGVGYDYIENGTNVIIFDSPPQTGDTIIVDYIKI